MLTSFRRVGLLQAVMASPVTSELSCHPGTLVVGHTLTSMGKPIPYLGLLVLGAGGSLRRNGTRGTIYNGDATYHPLQCLRLLLLPQHHPLSDLSMNPFFKKILPGGSDGYL